MRYSLAEAEKSFFKKNHLILFHDLLSTADMQSIVDASISGPCRNFWSKSPLGRKLVLNRSRSEIAAQLFQEKTLRIAYDELIIGNGAKMGHKAIKDLSPVQGTVGCALINLGCTVDSPLPEKMGDVTYFSYNALLPLDYIYAKDTRFLLIVYCNKTPVYRYHSDRLFHTEGYNFGDRLSEKTAPVACTYNG